jgi:hypothetical protein
MFLLIKKKRMNTESSSNKRRCFSRALTACNADEGLSFKFILKSRSAFYTPLQYNMVLFEIKRSEV